MHQAFYFFEQDGRDLGPLSAQEIVQLVAEGLLEPQSPVRDAAGQTIAASAIVAPPCLPSAVPPPPPGPMHPLITGRAAWNPLAIGGLGLLFSPLWTAIMAVINARRLGLDRPVFRPLVIAVALLMLDCGISWLLLKSQLVSLLLFLMAAGLIWHLDLRSQLPAYQRHVAGQRRDAGWLIPVLAGLPGAMAVLVSFVVVPLLPPLAPQVVINNQGVTFLENGEFDAAIAQFSEAIRQDPTFALAFSNRGEAYFRKGDAPQAIADFTVALRLVPSMVPVYVERAMAYHDQGDLDKAVADCNEALRRRPDDSDAHNIRGLVHLDRQEWALAMSDFNEALRSDSRNAKAYNNRGLVHFRQGDYDKALADFDTAIRLQPQLSVARDNKAAAEAARAQKREGNRPAPSTSERIAGQGPGLPQGFGPLPGTPPFPGLLSSKPSTFPATWPAIIAVRAAITLFLHGGGGKAVAIFCAALAAGATAFWRRLAGRADKRQDTNPGDPHDCTPRE